MNKKLFKPLLGDIPQFYESVQIDKIEPGVNIRKVTNGFYNSKARRLDFPIIPISKLLVKLKK